MKIECVIVCKDYSDFLAHTLPENIELVDRIVVVTHYDDKATQALCNKYSVDCIQTGVFHEDGDKFNKGRAINLAMAHLRGEDWIMHLDADIVLPHRFRDLLYRSKLNRQNLYGADRVNVYGYEHWMDHKHKTVPSYASGYFVQPPKEFPLGARIIHFELGYTPIGYFQLWNRQAHKRYPIHQGTAEHTDVLFAAQWPREQRVLLPEVVCYHLESGHAPIPMGTNWNGRKARNFCPCHPHHPHCHPHKPPYKPHHHKHGEKP